MNFANDPPTINFVLLQVGTLTYHLFFFSYTSYHPLPRVVGDQERCLALKQRNLLSSSRRFVFHTMFLPHHTTQCCTICSHSSNWTILMLAK